MAGGTKKVSAASARSHTRKSKQTTSLNLSPIMIVQVGVALLAGLLGWAYVAIKPPPPKVCGTPGGPPVTSPRVQLSDGRHLAYKEKGVPKEEAKYKIIVIHGFDSSKDLDLAVSQEFIEELGIYFLLFDRAGYGESDPHPKRSVKGEALDIQELADKLDIGSKFYLIGFSMGAYPVWSCLKYIPHRHDRASLVVPFVHYWWPRFPNRVADISKKGIKTLPARDRWTFRVAHYAPWLFNWWMTQKWFPNLSIMTGNMAVFCDPDLEMLKILSSTPTVGQEKIQQQGIYESLYRDILVGYSKWDFGPLDIANPFPNNEGSIHIWQGREDRIIPSLMNRYIAEKLPWIRYHEVPDAGHLMMFNSTFIGSCRTVGDANRNQMSGQFIGSCRTVGKAAPSKGVPNVVKRRAIKRRAQFIKRCAEHDGEALECLGWRARLSSGGKGRAMRVAALAI
ncbi:hypothetical protein TEA_002974 [Camellia sinensis var. sinensis]|uniref:AB hydrolase-1 domain-containing protein n=1 Tax=Camellia sinensis var. sinensis TaxID=542762 RepID=A0A4S4DAF3_CAMSN|nr:hypothetical protein TEA_002974 [Camellia sinensis var. sinensis]